MDVENIRPTTQHVNGKGKSNTLGQRPVLSNITNAHTAQSRPKLKEIKNADTEQRKPVLGLKCDQSEVAATEPNKVAAPSVVTETTPTSMPSDESMEIDSLECEDDLPRLLGGMEVAFREPTYSSEAFSYWKNVQKKFLPIPKYMSRQREIDWEMRSTLIDWLVEVGEEFKLCNETLYLSVAYVDRFLSVMSCSRDKLQLAGVTAMFIASKYEEIYPPTAAEFVNLTDNTYNIRQLLRLEKSMLKALKFQLSQPSANAFLEHMLKEYDDIFKWTTQENFYQLENLAKYVCELTLLQGDTFLTFPPSYIAASSIYVAASALKLTDWQEVVPMKSGHSLKSLEQCIRYTSKLYMIAPKLSYTAISDKYKDERFGAIANLLAPKNNAQAE